MSMKAGAGSQSNIDTTNQQNNPNIETFSRNDFDFFNVKAELYKQGIT